MTDNKKQIISLRLSGHDLTKVKYLGQRLEARESSVLRFGIRRMLSNLGPLHDPDIKGKDLLPVLIEMGPDLVRYFELDANQLDDMINGDLTDESERIDHADLELLVKSAIHEDYLYLKLKEFADRNQSVQGPSSLLREYFYEKYLRTESSEVLPLRSVSQ